MDGDEGAVPKGDSENVFDNRELPLRRLAEGLLSSLSKARRLRFGAVVCSLSSSSAVVAGVIFRLAVLWSSVIKIG